MKLLPWIRGAMVTLSLAVWLLPVRPSLAGPPKSVVAPTALRDVALSPAGRLFGQLVTQEGLPLAGQTVSLLQDNRIVAQAFSDNEGRFAIDNVRAGLHQVTAPGVAFSARLWTSDAAPPAAVREMLLVSGPQVERGQRPIVDLLADPIVMGLIIAAAIAIPVIVHNAKKDKPSGS